MQATENSLANYHYVDETHSSELDTINDMPPDDSATFVGYICMSSLTSE